MPASIVALIVCSVIGVLITAGGITVGILGATYLANNSNYQHKIKMETISGDQQKLTENLIKNLGTAKELQNKVVEDIESARAYIVKGLGKYINDQTSDLKNNTKCYIMEVKKIEKKVSKYHNISDQNRGLARRITNRHRLLTDGRRS